MSEKKVKNFDELVKLVLLRHFTDELKKDQKRIFWKNKSGRIIDITESLYSGALHPILIWQMNRRLFEMNNGRRPMTLQDLFSHNVNVAIYETPQMLFGCTIGPINEDDISVSKEDFIFLLYDAIQSLYDELPYIQDVIPEVEDKGKIINPAIDVFVQWRALNIQVRDVLLSSPEVVNNPSIPSKLPIQIVGDLLEYLGDGKRPKSFPMQYVTKPFKQLLMEITQKEKATQAQPFL